MGKKRMIDTDFWNDTHVVDHLNPLDRYLFIYLFTNPHSTIAGAYQLSLRIMSFETGIEREELLRMLVRLDPKVKYMDGWVILRNGIKNQNYRNSKIAAGILAVLEDVPETILQHISWPKDFGNPKPEGSKQTTLLDESFMSHDESLHLNKNKIKNKTKIQTPAVAVGGSKNFDGRKYAQAVRADEAQADRATAARGRPRSEGYAKFQSMRDILKSKKVKTDDKSRNPNSHSGSKKAT